MSPPSSPGGWRVVIHSIVPDAILVKEGIICVGRIYFWREVADRRYRTIPYSAPLPMSKWLRGSLPNEDRGYRTFAHQRGETRRPSSFSQKSLRRGHWPHRGEICDCSSSAELLPMSKEIEVSFWDSKKGAQEKLGCDLRIHEKCENTDIRQDDAEPKERRPDYGDDPVNRGVSGPAKPKQADHTEP